MKITFFSDPHIGCHRTSHTTLQSRAALKEALLKQAQRAVSLNHPHVCLGDVFDRFSNSEETIKGAAKIVIGCGLVLAGNHDMSADTTQLSSLQLLEQILPEDFINVAFEPVHKCIGGVNLVAIPHCLSQTDFEAKLQEEFDRRMLTSLKGETSMLLLHCNYDNALTESAEASLNLSKEWAGKLLSVFDYVLIGHEHIPRTDFDGHLIVLGNTHPTSFADISDKYVWEFDTDTRAFTPHMIWDPQDGYDAVGWTFAIEGGNAQFIDVIGEAEASDMPKVAKTVAAVWKLYPNALMVRNQVEVKRDTSVNEVSHSPVTRLNALSLIAEELKGSPIADLFNHYAKQL